jgi:hypothetical protein
MAYKVFVILSHFHPNIIFAAAFNYLPQYARVYAIICHFAHRLIFAGRSLEWSPKGVCLRLVCTYKTMEEVTYDD